VGPKLVVLNEQPKRLEESLTHSFVGHGDKVNSPARSRRKLVGDVLLHERLRTGQLVVVWPSWLSIVSATPATAATSRESTIAILAPQSARRACPVPGLGSPPANTLDMQEWDWRMKAGTPPLGDRGPLS
jgi:hypothetical protein